MQHPPRLRWRTLTAVALATLALPATAGAVSQPEIDAAVQNGGAWITSQQKADGSLPGFQGDWALTSLAAAGINAADVRSADATQSLQDYWQAQYAAPTYATLPNTNVAGTIGKAALLAHAAGIDPKRVSPTVNLAASLASRWNAEKGQLGPSPAINSDGFALLAGPYLDLPRGVQQKLTAIVRRSQHNDGGWVFGADGNLASNGDIDMTGAAMAMICGTGADATDPQIVKGASFLRGKLNDTTGGFAAGLGTQANNIASAGWAVIGLNACGIDPQGRPGRRPPARRRSASCSASSARAAASASSPRSRTRPRAAT